MSPAKCEEDHAKECSAKLQLFTLVNPDCIHVELCCDQCNKRYVYDIYNLIEV